MENKKAYDVKLLLEQFKGEGLELAEESVKIVINGLFKWLEESAMLSETPYDNMAVVLYPKLKELALEQAEKINKSDNE